MAFEGFHIYKTEDDLPFHLRCHCRIDVDTGISVFHHKFLVSLMPLFLPVPIEEALKAREADAYRALAQDGAEAFLVRVERPYRLDTLYDMGMTGYFEDDPEIYWKALAYCWMDSEIDESEDIWSKVLKIDIPNRKAIMGTEDRTTFDAMPDRIQVYRGVQAASETDAHRACLAGHSWSLSEEIARKFALRMAEGTGSWIAKAEMDKSGVICFLGGRGEEEIIVAPEVAAEYRIEMVEV